MAQGKSQKIILTGNYIDESYANYEISILKAVLMINIKRRGTKKR